MAVHDPHPARLAARIVASPAFRWAVLSLIVLNAALMGLETHQPFAARFAGLLVVAHGAIQALFVLEIAIRVLAYGRRPLAFLRDGWNVFDAAVVGVSLLPAAGPFATVARLARVLRTVRLVSALPDLRLIIGTMLRSIPSMGHVIALLGLLLYIYGILGFKFFGASSPERWGTLPAAFGSLFQILTLEGWVEIQAEVLPGHPWAWIYFASFIVIAVFVVINLFIAVVINNLEETHREEERRKLQSGAHDPLAHLDEIRARLDAIEQGLGRSRRSA